MTLQSNARGFTLMEMMIAVAIIAIIAAIAYPSYQEYIRRAHRAEGIALLNDASARQERFFVQNNAYVTQSANLGKLGMRNTSGEGNATAVTSDNGYYKLTVSAPNGSGGYLLTATPQGAQASDSKCRNLTLNAAGTRGISGSGSSSDCWK
ncbi:type IV pilin protein [Pseudomonas sp. MT3]|nr:type IV pilin protein [uncultured Pseudomonas sp.]